MSDRSPIDDSLVNFDQQSSSSVTTPNKVKTMDFHENRSSDDIDLLGHGTNGTNGTHAEEHHNGTNGVNHHDSQSHSVVKDHSLVDTHEHENEHSPFEHPAYSTRKNEESDNSPWNFSANINGGIVDRSGLLLDLNPNISTLQSTEKVVTGLTPSPSQNSKPFSETSSPQQHESQHVHSDPQTMDLSDERAVSEENSSNLTKQINDLIAQSPGQHEKSVTPTVPSPSSHQENVTSLVKSDSYEHIPSPIKEQNDYIHSSAQETEGTIASSNEKHQEDLLSMNDDQLQMEQVSSLVEVVYEPISSSAEENVPKDIQEVVSEQIPSSVHDDHPEDIHPTIDQKLEQTLSSTVEQEDVNQSPTYEQQEHVNEPVEEDLSQETQALEEKQHDANIDLFVQEEAEVVSLPVPQDLEHHDTHLISTIENEEVVEQHQKAAFDEPEIALASFNTDEQLQSDANEQNLIDEACAEVDQAAQDLAAKIDLVTSPSPPSTSDPQPAPVFPEVPTNFNTETISPSTEPLASSMESTEVLKTPVSDEHQIEPPVTPKLDSTLPIVSPTSAPTLASPSAAVAASPAKKEKTTAVRASVAPKTKSAPTGAATAKTTDPKPTATAASASKATEHKTTTGASAKSSEHRSTATAASKIAEPKTVAAAPTRRVPNSAPTTSHATASHPAKVTPTSPTQDTGTASKTASKIASAGAASASKARPTASTTATSASSAGSRSTLRPTAKPTRPSTMPKPAEAAVSDEPTTVLSTAPDAATVPAPAAPSASVTAKTTSRASQLSSKPPTKATSSAATGASSHAATTSRTGASASKTAVPKERPVSNTRTPAIRSTTATHAATTVTTQRSTSANRTGTSDVASRPAREAASGTTVTSAKPQWNSASSKTTATTQHAAVKPASTPSKVSNQKSSLLARPKAVALDNKQKGASGVAKNDPKKGDGKEKSKTTTSENDDHHEVMTSAGGDGVVEGEHQQISTESAEEKVETQTNQDGDQ